MSDWSYLIDMDGVLVREDCLVPGAEQFIAELIAQDTEFLLLTNNSMYAPRDLRARLNAAGLDIGVERIWTSALATAEFLQNQRPHGSAYVIGEAGLTTALHQIGYTLTERDPDYVVLGETYNYSFAAITNGIRLILGGSRFIATNPDATGPSHHGMIPSVGSVAALIETATGHQPYFIGKPNPLMMRSALRALGSHSENTVLIGDRMDTDVVAGLEAGLPTILVLSGISTAESIKRFPYRPRLVLESVAELIGRTQRPFEDPILKGQLNTAPVPECST